MKSYLVVALLVVSLSLVESIPHQKKPLDKRFIQGLWNHWFDKSSEEEEVTEAPAPQEPAPDCSEAEAKLKEWIDEHGDHTDKRFVKDLWNKWFGSKSEEEEPSAEAPEPTQPSPADCSAIEAKLKELMEGHPDHEDETTMPMPTSPPPTPKPTTPWGPETTEDFTWYVPTETFTMPETTWMPDEFTEDFPSPPPTTTEPPPPPPTTEPPPPPPTTEPQTPDESDFFTSPPSTFMPDEFTGDFFTPPTTTEPQTPDEGDFFTSPPTTGMPDEEFTSPAGPAESWMTWVPEDSSGCVDELYNCKELALKGKCNRNENTRRKCANSCICNPPCEDVFFNCADLASRDKCQTKPVVQQRCKKTCGLC